jgi:hypothetical protein
MEGGPGGGGPGSLQLLDDLAENFTTLTIERVDGRVRILSTGHSSTCSAGGVATFADSAGSGERRCGWSGAAWVVETKRGAGFKRTDRYEAASDGKTLNHLTTVVISGTPAIKISRTYVRPDQ